nr:hypothetical protein [Tanacetum cinerariifolium]
QSGNHLNPSEVGYPFAFLRNRLWTLDEDPSPFLAVNSTC